MNFVVVTIVFAIVLGHSFWFYRPEARKNGNFIYWGTICGNFGGDFSLEKYIFAWKINFWVLVSAE